MDRIADLFRVKPEGSVRLTLGQVASAEVASWRAREAFSQALWNVAPDRMLELFSTHQGSLLL